GSAAEHGGQLGAIGRLSLYAALVRQQVGQAVEGGELLERAARADVPRSPAFAVHRHGRLVPAAAPRLGGHDADQADAAVKPVVEGIAVRRFVARVARTGDAGDLA